MTFPDSNLNQTAVYWGSPTPDGSGGYTYADPVEIACRWVQKTQVLTIQNGIQIVSRAQVQVSQDLDEEGLLFLGDLDDLDSAEEESPRTVNAAYKILQFKKVPTIKSGLFFRKAYL